MKNIWLHLGLFACLLPGDGHSAAQQAGNALQPTPASCDMQEARAWISDWFAAWELTSTEILHLPKTAAPEIVFFDDKCVWTTAPASAPAAGVIEGPGLLGETLRWRTAAHEGKITLPDGAEVPLGMLVFAAPNGRGGEFFVMPAPSFWAQAGVKSDEFGFDRLLTSIFIHEFAHTRQIVGFQSVIEPIERDWRGDEEITDNTVQQTFGDDAAYAAAFAAERDALFSAAAADSIDEARAQAAHAQTLMQARHARWFSGRQQAFGALDDTFLSFEGAGQFAGYAWLLHRKGGNVDRETALRGVRRGGRFWSQDEGLALFMLLDRLLADWSRHAFHAHPQGAAALLERAVGGELAKSEESRADRPAGTQPAR